MLLKFHFQIRKLQWETYNYLALWIPFSGTEWLGLAPLSLIHHTPSLKCQLSYWLVLWPWVCYLTCLKFSSSSTNFKQTYPFLVDRYEKNFNDLWLRDKLSWNLVTQCNDDLPIDNSGFWVGLSWAVLLILSLLGQLQLLQAYLRLRTQKSLLMLRWSEYQRLAEPCPRAGFSSKDVRQNSQITQHQVSEIATSVPGEVSGLERTYLFSNILLGKADHKDSRIQ